MFPNPAKLRTRFFPARVFPDKFTSAPRLLARPRQRQVLEDPSAEPQGSGASGPRPARPLDASAGAITGCLERIEADLDRLEVLLRAGSSSDRADPRATQRHASSRLLAVDLLPVVVYEADLRHRFLSVAINPALARRLGWPERLPPLADDLWRAGVSPEDRDDLEAALSRLEGPEGKFVAEYRWRGAEGREVWIHDEAIVGEEADPPGGVLVGAMLDVTDRREAELGLTAIQEGFERRIQQRTANLLRANQRLQEELEELREARSAYFILESILRTIDCPLLIAADEGGTPQPEIVFVNDRFQALTGLGPESLRGRPLAAFLRVNADPATLESLRRALDEGMPFEGPCLSPLREGGEAPARWRVDPIVDESGRRTRFLVQLRFLEPAVAGLGVGER